MGEFGTSQFWIDLARIMGIDILLSGDNAVVIALASRSLPEQQRKWAIFGGSGAAIGLRVLFATIIVWLLAIPYLKLVGGLLLLYIGVKLILPEHEGHGEGRAATNLWGAIRTIVIADAVMSLDNVVAIAAAARGSVMLLVLGLLMSVPLIVFGSQMVLGVLHRFPFLITLGGGLLGWIAGEIIVTDPFVQERLPYDEHANSMVAKLVGAVGVMLTGTALSRWFTRDAADIDLARKGTS